MGCSLHEALMFFKRLKHIGPDKALGVHSDMHTFQLLAHLSNVGLRGGQKHHHF